MSPSEQSNGLSVENPFKSTDPVAESSRFYGHKSDIQRIYTRIGAERPQCISIIGEKSIGKSSLLNYLSHPKIKENLLSDPPRYLFGCLHLKRQPIGAPDEFLKKLTDSLREGHPDIPEVSDYNSFRELIQHLDKEKLSLVAFFDDFDMVTQNPDFPLTFFSFLRSMANTYNVAYVTSSSESLQRLCVSKDVEESPFFNIFTNITLKPLDQPEVKQWIIEGSNPSGVSLSSEAEWVYEQVGGFPGLVRDMCALLWELKSNKGKLNDSDLSEVEINYQDKYGDEIEYIWNSFAEREQNLCIHLLTSQELDRPQEHLSRDLTRRGYIQEEEGIRSLFGKSFERFVSGKAGIEFKSESPKKRRWWKLGK